MNITMINTIKSYRDMLRKDPSLRQDYLENELLKDFKPMFNMLGMPMEQLLRSFLSVSESKETYYHYLHLMEQVNIEAKCLNALNKSVEACRKKGINVPDQLTFGVYLGDPKALAHSEGYTGFGGIPGYIQMVIAPTPENLAKLPGAVCHEFHHNCMFLMKPFNPMTILLKDYLLYEGMAEHFAEEMYGESMVGPWVTHVSEEDCKLSKSLIAPALDRQGFQAVMPYIFGGQPVTDSNGHSVTMPSTGGYAIGYNIVKAYCQQTGLTTLDAMTKSSDEIIEKSLYFNN